MSKVIKAIEIHQTNNSRIIDDLPKTFYIESNYLKRPFVKEYEYELSVKFKVKQFSKEEDYLAHTDAKRMLIEDIFGEFRPILMEALESTYERDFAAVRQAIYKLEDKMFREGIH